MASNSFLTEVRGREESVGTRRKSLPNECDKGQGRWQEGRSGRQKDKSQEPLRPWFYFE